MYALDLPKAHKDSIWTLSLFNEENFSQICSKPYSGGHLCGFVKTLCCLLIGPRWTRKGSETNMRMYTHVDSHGPVSSRPRGNDDSHYRLKVRWPRCPYTQQPIKLPDSFIVLVFDNFLSSVIRSASGSCCMGVVFRN